MTEEKAERKIDYLKSVEEGMRKYLEAKPRNRYQLALGKKRTAAQRARWEKEIISH